MFSRRVNRLLLFFIVVIIEMGLTTPLFLHAQGISNVRKEARILYNLWPYDEENPIETANFNEHMANFKALVDGLEDSGVSKKRRKPYEDLTFAWGEVQIAQIKTSMPSKNQEICFADCTIEHNRAEFQRMAGKKVKENYPQCNKECRKTYKKTNPVALEGLRKAIQDLRSQYLKLGLIRDKPAKKQLKSNNKTQ